MILAADIGGTKSALSYFYNKSDKIYVVEQKRYLNKHFNSFEEVLEAFLKAYPAIEKIEYACFAAAGPIIDDKCYMVNLGWTIDKKKLTEKFPNIHNIILCNDLEAVGFGIKILQKEEIITLTPNILQDIHHHNNVTKYAILAPGTGLGEAFLINSKVFSSEGSHSNFGPNSKKQMRLWAYLFDKFGHVSYERILSGPGLREVFLFIMNEKRINNVEFEILPEEITKRALTGTCEICKETVALFIEVLGSEAGNLALRTLSMNGIYLGGGILPNILPLIQTQVFLDEFYKKGRFSDLMKKIPVYIIMNSNAALYGAALVAFNTLYPLIHFHSMENTPRS
jgi:glucokinase